MSKNLEFFLPTSISFICLFSVSHPIHFIFPVSTRAMYLINNRNQWQKSRYLLIFLLTIYILVHWDRNSTPYLLLDRFFVVSAPFGAFQFKNFCCCWRNNLIGLPVEWNVGIWNLCMHGCFLCIALWAKNGKISSYEWSQLN